MRQDLIVTAYQIREGDAFTNDGELAYAFVRRTHDNGDGTVTIVFDHDDARMDKLCTQRIMRWSYTTSPKDTDPLLNPDGSNKDLSAHPDCDACFDPFSGKRHTHSSRTSAPEFDPAKTVPPGD